MAQGLSAAEWFEAGTRTGVRRAGDPHRWQRCVDHRGRTVRQFAIDYFSDSRRSILLLGGAGFDPRSLSITRLLTAVVQGQLNATFLRERRPNPSAPHLARADDHVVRLRELIPAASVTDVNVFESDGAVGIGRHVVDVVRAIDLASYTDVVVDFSALSIGSSFPLTRFILERIESEGIATNLHAMVTARPRTDHRIVPSPSAIVGPVHGFRGRLGLDETARAAKLWIPQLRFDHGPILEQLFAYLNPDDVVPVLPFPSADPRVGDHLIDHYGSEFENRWSVDSRNIVYADETNPLDFYRTVLRIDDGRFPVFEGTGGSLLLLSPIGSKVLAIGAMMAAIERDLPVIYVEALAYSTTLGPEDEDYSDDDLVHVWLSGRDAYPGALKRSST